MPAKIGSYRPCPVTVCQSARKLVLLRPALPMAAEDSANGLVGATHAQLEQFALNPTVAPAGVLASQAQDELAALGGETGASEPGAAGEQGPPAPDEIEMPSAIASGG